MKNEVLIRMYLVLTGFVLVAGLLFFQAIKISVSQGDKWREIGEKRYLKYESVTAERGNILSDNNSLLATSLDFYKIHFDTKAAGLTDKIFEKNVDSLAYCLSKHVNSSHTPGGMRKRLLDAKKKGARYMSIAKDVSFEKLEKIRKFPIFNRGRNGGGFIVESTPKRFTPFNLLAKRTIGYVREDAKPVGIEGAFDKYLQGQNGKRLTLRVNDKVRIPINEEAEIKPINGKDIVTSIDIDLQGITENSLLTALKHHNAQSGTAILMDVKTGAVKSIANLEKTASGYFETYNFGVGSSIEPGSVFKLASLLALLEEGKVDLHDNIPIYRGEKEFYTEKMEDSSSESFTMDSTTVQHAFEISSNVGIASLVYDNYQGVDAEGNIRVKRLLNMFKKFNLYEPTGIEIHGEPDPYIKDPDNANDNWSGLTLPWMSIGYEVTMTPLQILSFYNSIANDGLYVKPYLVSEIKEGETSIEVLNPILSKRRIASRETISKAKKLLDGVVESGTARKLQTDKYNFSGKTGTSQINYRSGKKKKLGHRSSFVGYFPSHAPKYSCIVIITDPKEDEIYGADVAGPVFREIMDKIFYYKPELHKALNNYKKPQLADNSLPQHFAGSLSDMTTVFDLLKLPYKIESSSEMMTTVQARDKVLVLKERPCGENLIPNVVGMGVRDALFVLENQGMKVKVKGIGKVTAQSVKPGTRVTDQLIQLTLG